MTQFLIKDTLIPPYMAFPRFLLDMEQLSETAKYCMYFCWIEQDFHRKTKAG